MTHASLALLVVSQNASTSVTPLSAEKTQLLRTLKSELNRLMRLEGDAGLADESAQPVRARLEALACVSSEEELDNLLVRLGHTRQAHLAPDEVWRALRLLDDTATRHRHALLAVQDLFSEAAPPYFL
jgi:hypothetical protein